MTVFAGDITNAADVNALEPAWATYPVAWGAASTSPSLGNGTLTGGYTKVGVLVHVQILFAAGSTTTFGTGRWTFTLPFAAAENTCLAAVAIDDSATSRFAGVAWVTTGTGVFAIAPGAGGNGFANTSPFTWAVNDGLLINGTYRTT